MNTNMYLSTCCVRAFDSFVWGLPCVSHFHLEIETRVSRSSCNSALRSAVVVGRCCFQRTPWKRTGRLRIETKTMTWQDLWARSQTRPTPAVHPISIYLHTGIAEAAASSGPNWIFIKKAVVDVVVILSANNRETVPEPLQPYTSSAVVDAVL